MRFNGKAVPRQTVETAERLLAAFNEAAGTRHGGWTGSGKPSDSLKRIVGALVEHPDVGEGVWRVAVRVELGRPDPYWDSPHVGVVFGPRAVDRCLENARRNGAGGSGAGLAAVPVLPHDDLAGAPPLREYRGSNRPAVGGAA